MIAQNILTVYGIILNVCNKTSVKTSLLIIHWLHSGDNFSTIFKVPAFIIILPYLAFYVTSFKMYENTKYFGDKLSVFT